jgi:hypothetical protein
VAPDHTAPAIEPSVTGTLGANGWYVSDVAVTWRVTDDESPIAASTGCEAASVTADTDGITYTCSATSAGGSHSESVTIKRDATAPVVSATRAPAANANGWNNTDVTATYSATDAMSGVAGDATFVQVFSMNGANQSGAHTFSDRAGNSATATIGGINIDKGPVVAACSVTPSEVWPPDNRMVAVRVTIAGDVSFTLRSATNNETGASDVAGFVIGAADLEGSVRAARKGSGNGRVYTLAYDLVNRAGSLGSCSVTVAVPHDRGER